MAYILNKRIVKDTDEFSNHAYGIMLPASPGNGTMFQQSFSSFESAKSNLKNLLLTNKGERPFQPEFGTGLQSLLFEQLDENLEEKLESLITDSVDFWLPYINIEEIEVEMTDEMKDRNTAEVKLIFSVGGQFESQELTFNI
tara:strand:- start:21 stop:446 length:426 start_codon:yes stop_codon:yes gene_type:complete